MVECREKPRRNFLGLDIGGTKIAGATLSEEGETLASAQVATPQDYPEFLGACASVVNDLDKVTQSQINIGISITGMVDKKAGCVTVAHNLPFLQEKPFIQDLSALIHRDIRMANDANCAALAEAIDGAGAGFDLVLGLIVGTGVGSALVHKGNLIEGANGLTGEVGHLPLPFRDSTDAETKCGCGQSDCLEKAICGPALAALYMHHTGKQADAPQIAAMAQAKDPEAQRVLDIYYDTFAKAMVTIIHSFDPDVIVVSGGISNLEQLYVEVPKRWGQYAIASQPNTKIVPAKHGPLAGLRGAAWLWR